MEDDDQFLRERDELLKRFADSLGMPETQREFFDEDTLCDIFDYAGDTGQDLLRAEALMQGARYYPDSDSLRRRRAIFYADVLPEASLSEVGRTLTGDQCLLSTLVALRTANLSSEEKLQRICELLKSKPKLDDEECIQLANLCYESGNTEWLMKNIDRLRKLAEYPATLTFEAATLAEDTGDNARCARLMEELVEDVPYRAEYWAMYAGALQRLGRSDDALQAAEMALAIEPEQLVAMRIRGELLLSMGAANAVDEIEAMASRKPEDKSLAEMVFRSRYEPKLPKPGEPLNDELRDAIRDLAGRFPDSEYATSLYVGYLPDESYEVLKNLWNGAQSSPDSAASWTRWAVAVADAGSVEGALRILDVLSDSGALDGNGGQMEEEVLTNVKVLRAHMLHHLGRNQEALDVLDSLSVGASDNSNKTDADDLYSEAAIGKMAMDDPILSALRVSLLMELGRQKEARMLAEATIEAAQFRAGLRRPWHLGSILTEVGTVKVLLDFLKQLK